MHIGPRDRRARYCADPYGPTALMNLWVHAYRGVMILFLIHGAPATGKLTVAKELAALTGTPLVDNHAAIDIGRMVFGFAAPGFWDLVHDLRVTTLRGAARAGVPRLITTAAYCHPEDLPLVEEYERAVEPYAGVIKPIHLSCSEDTLMARVSAPDRVQRGKLSTQAALADYLERNAFAAIPRPNCLSLSTETASAKHTASLIATHFGMPIASAAGDDGSSSA